MNKELLADIRNDLFENNHITKQKLLLDNIVDAEGNINITNLNESVRNDALEFKEILEYQKISLSSVLFELQRNYQSASDMGIIYSIYFYCLDSGFFLPNMLKAFAKNGLIKVYCSVFMSQLKAML